MRWFQSKWFRRQPNTAFSLSSFFLKKTKTETKLSFPKDYQPLNHLYKERGNEPKIRLQGKQTGPVLPNCQNTYQLTVCSTKQWCYCTGLDFAKIFMFNWFGSLPYAVQLTTHATEWKWSYSKFASSIEPDGFSQRKHKLFYSLGAFVPTTKTKTKNQTTTKITKPTTYNVWAYVTKTNQPNLSVRKKMLGNLNTELTASFSAQYWSKESH